MKTKTIWLPFNSRQVKKADLVAEKTRVRFTDQSDLIRKYIAHDTFSIYYRDTDGIIEREAIVTAVETNLQVEVIRTEEWVTPATAFKFEPNKTRVRRSLTNTEGTYVATDDKFGYLYWKAEDGEIHAHYRADLLVLSFK